MPPKTSFEGVDSIKRRFDEADFTYTELHREDTELHRAFIPGILFHSGYPDSVGASRCETLRKKAH